MCGVCVYMCVFVCMWCGVCMYVCVCLFVYVVWYGVCMYVFVCMCVCVWYGVCMYVFVCVCVCVCGMVCVCMCLLLENNMFLIYNDQMSQVTCRGTYRDVVPNHHWMHSPRDESHADKYSISHDMPNDWKRKWRKMSIWSTQSNEHHMWLHLEPNGCRTYFTQLPCLHSFKYVYKTTNARRHDFTHAHMHLNTVTWIK